MKRNIMWPKTTLKCSECDETYAAVIGKTKLCPDCEIAQDGCILRRVEQDGLITVKVSRVLH